MHAIERLRSIARAGEVESTELACEAAYALAGLANDRRALLASCRRLIEFHPHVGALWWVCAQLIDAIDPQRCATALVDQLEHDASVDELFALPSARDRVVAESSRQIVRALCDRFDLPVRLVGDRRSLALGSRFFAGSVVPIEAYKVNESEPAFRDATLVVIEALAISRGGLLVSASAAHLIGRAREREIPTVALTGVGRLLPESLFGAMRALGHQLETRDEDRSMDAGKASARALNGELIGDQHPIASRPGAPERIFRNKVLISPDWVGRYVTTRGAKVSSVLFHPSPSVSHLTCPVPDELLFGFGATR